MGIPILDNATEGSRFTIPVSSKHPLYDKFLPVWEKCRDAYEGEEAIKAKKTDYLPSLNGQKPAEYESYLERAQWFGATNRTVQSYQGMVFRKDPLYHYYSVGEESAELNSYMSDYFSVITHDGKSLDRFIHDVSEEVIITNRVGVLIDMPPLDPASVGNMTLYDYETQGRKPMLSMYKTESIINWHTEVVNNQVVPVMYILHESELAFTGKSLLPQEKDVYRILYLENYDNPSLSRYKSIKMEMMRGADDSTGLFIKEVTYPMIDGKYMSRIPFFVVTDRGLVDKTIFYPMINDLVNTNIGHFRNSADWENELHWVGVKTMYFPDWDVETYGQPRIGGALAGPKDTVPVLLEPRSDSGIKDEMNNKEGRMAILGAERISQKGRYIPSAETARITAASEVSTLSNMVRALSKAFTQIANFVIQWDNRVISEKFPDVMVSVEVNSDFYQDDISGEELIKWMSAWQQGGISFDAYYWNLEKKEVFPEHWTKELELERIRETSSLFGSSAVYNPNSAAAGNPFIEYDIDKMDGNSDNAVPRPADDNNQDDNPEA